MMDNKPVYLCDPEKNKLCDKEGCYISGGPCSHTFNKAYEKKQTNQDKLAEMVRTEDPMTLADRIYDHTICSVCYTPGLHYCPLASTCTKQGSQSKMECIYDICDWLKEDTE